MWSKYLLGLMVMAGTSCELPSQKKQAPSAETETEVQVDSKQEAGYRINNPDRILKMPNILQEISALTPVGPETFGTVQDERGVIFTYNIETEKILNEYSFGPDGDYEGLARVGKDMYILRSDARLYEVKDYTSGNFKAKEHRLSIPVHNNEGLAYDKKNNRLLIGPKDQWKKGYPDGHVLLYAFDLATKELTADPAVKVPFHEINQFISDHGITLYKGKKLKELRISALAIHPFTGDLYIVASRSRVMLVLNPDHEVKAVIPLDPKLFNQPEGITFMENGDMLISNEQGDTSHATVLLFKYRP